jgi:phage-related minor tail protein
METPFAVYDALSAISVPPDKIRVVVQSLERDMALFATSRQFNQLDKYSGSRFDLLHSDMDRRFEQVAQRFAQVDKQLEKIDQQLLEMHKSNGERFSRISNDIRQMQRQISRDVLLKLGGTLVGALIASETVLRLVFPRL